MTTRPTCKATTKDGDYCKNPTWKTTEYCYTHRDWAAQAGQSIQATWWEQLVGWVETSRRRVWWFGLGLLFTSLIVAFIGLYSDLTGKPFLNLFGLSPPPKDSRLYNVEIEGQDHNIIVAYDAQRQPLWQKEFDTGLRDVVVDDLNQDGNRQIVGATHEPGTRPGRVFVLDESGNQIAEHNTWKQSIYYGGAKPQMNVSFFEVVDLTGDGAKEIVVFSGDVYWYAGRLLVLRLRQGELVEIAEYWNPGLPMGLHVVDINHDGTYEIVGVAENNDLQSIPKFSLGGNVFVVFLLDGSNVSGQAPPCLGDAPQGSEIWYGFSVPASVGIREVDFEDVDEDGTLEVHVSLSDHCSYYLDYEGDVVGRGRGTGCQDESELRILR